MERVRALDVVGLLPAVENPVLVSVGALDPVTPVAAAQEIVDGLRPGIGRLDVVAGAGHFTSLDAPEHYWSTLVDFVHEVGRRS